MRRILLVASVATIVMIGAQTLWAVEQDRSFALMPIKPEPQPSAFALMTIKREPQPSPFALMTIKPEP